MISSFIILDILNLNGNHEVNIISAGNSDYSDFFSKFANLKCHLVPQSRWRKFGKLTFLLKSKYWIIGGGGLWPSENSYGLSVLLKEIRIAKKLHTKCCLYGIDINSITSSGVKQAWKSISEEVDYIYCRNARTTKMLKELSCKNVYRSSDLTFGLLTDAEKEERRECLQKLNICENGYVIWAVLMPWPTWEYDESKHGDRYHLLVHQLQEIANSPQYDGLTHVFLPFHYQMEIPIIRDIVCGIKGKFVVCDTQKQIDIGEKRLLFKYAKYCITMKFHGAMFAIFNGTPAAIVSYSDKTSDVLKELGLEEYYIEYGIRENQDFYKRFDLNLDEFHKIVERSCQPEARERFEHAGDILKALSGQCKERLISWLK